MWIVRLALRRPYTFVVASMLVCILGLLTIFFWMPTDIFPVVNIPVISVAFNYTGMSPEDMNARIVSLFERIITTTVNDVEHTESQSLYGIGVVKIYFYPNANIENANAQVTAIAQTAIRQMPTGTQPPLIIEYNASDVPILQLSLASDTIPEQQLFDQAVNFMRPGLVVLPGVQIPYPYGGKQRQVVVDLDPDRLYSYGLSPQDVADAINNQSLILPAGTAKIGKQEYQVKLNASPTSVETFNDLPVKSVGNTPVYVRDVANVRDGYIVQTNIVHADGKKGVLLSILKSGSASTLDVVKNVLNALPQVKQRMLSGIKITPMFDQSLFVRASVQGVVKEAAIAAGLTALMILLFLGSWRSTIIVMISIPLSIMVSIIILNFLGETLNVMTLGGMALAVGILVDDATVEIENIHRNLHQRKRLVKAILDGASQIAVPAFVSTLCICIVFVPVVFITGSAKYLFTPLAMAVVFAMLTSYLLSRTLVPTMVHYLLASEVEMYGGVLDKSDPHAQKAAQHEHRGEQSNFIWKIHYAFDHQFEKLRRLYGGLLAWALEHRPTVVICFGGLVLVSCSLIFFIGEDFFPEVDAGLLRLHVRCPPGTRIEQTERYFGDVEAQIRKIIPPAELGTVLDNMGIPNSTINLSLSDGSIMSPADGEILISLGANHHPTDQYQTTLRDELPKKFPNLKFFFAPADIITQVLNFGLQAPIDVQITGPEQNTDKDNQIANQILADVTKIPGIVDVRMQQVPDTPDLRVNVDRTLASLVGVEQKDVAGDLLVSLSSNVQTAPNYWYNQNNGIEYSIYIMTPQYKMDTINDLQNTPVTPTSFVPSVQDTQLLSNLATVDRGTSPTNITHYNPYQARDVLMSVAGTDLGAARDAISKILKKYTGSLPRGTQIVLRGQVQSMHSSFTALGWGLVFAVVLVYLLMVINFQSWVDPLIILMALPGALSGILWMLFVTGTTISVPALMGAIMSIGVATANSILMITFANDQRKHGMNSHDAALAAGLTRLRPVLMTALAMIIGMLPMSLGLGEGGEENAPLGRAVIGGLLLATFATLLFVPVVYSKLRQQAPETRVEPELR
jgi:multidrug efflux pump subunit AcrB